MQKVSRQVQRRARFQSVFAMMPKIETWAEVEDEPDEQEPQPEPASWVEELIPKVPDYQKVREDFKLIPRRVRRDMARKLIKRQEP